MPKLKPPADCRPPSPRQAHDRRCYLNGVTGTEDVERLWREAEAARAKAAGPKKKGRRRKRRGTD